MKYIKLELLSMFSFALLLTISRGFGNSVITNHTLNTLMTIIFLTNTVVILIIIPAMALLLFRDKVSPKGINRRNFAININISYLILSIILLSFIYISLYILQNIFFTTLLLTVLGLMILFFFLFSNKSK